MTFLFEVILKLLKITIPRVFPLRIPKGILGNFGYGKFGNFDKGGKFGNYELKLKVD